MNHEQIDKVAECRGCHKRLDGSPYEYGGVARDPDTGTLAKVNYYGGWVCSRGCDFKASLELERSMPGNGAGQQSLDGFSAARLEGNWWPKS